MSGDEEDADEGGSEGAQTRRASEVPLPGGDFRLFVTRLSFQAMIALGLIENPLTKRKQVNADGARMLVDDLEMLRDKTFGNLDDDESAYLDKIIGDLRHHLSRVG
jgi:hypothetical protein